MSASVAYTIARIGSTTLFFVLSTLFVVALFVIRFYTDAVFAIITLGGTMCTVGFIKVWWFKDRPADKLIPLRSSSFPSGHSAASAAFSSTVLVVMYPYFTTPAFYTLLISGTLITVSIAWSRLVLRVHRPDEVIAGVLIAFFWVLGAALFVYAL